MEIWRCSSFSGFKTRKKGYHCFTISPPLASNLGAVDCQLEGKEGRCVGWQSHMSLESIVQLTLLYPLHQQESCGTKNMNLLQENLASILNAF